MGLPRTGIYGIINVKFDVPAFLPPVNDDVTVDKALDFWQVTQLPNGLYLIQKAGMKEGYAGYDFPPHKGSIVYIGLEGKEWRLSEAPINDNAITIAPPDIGDLFWGLENDEKETPVTLQPVPMDPKNQWMFVMIPRWEIKSFISVGKFC